MHAGVEFGDKGEVTYVKFKRSSIDSGEEEHLHETVHVEEHTESTSLLAQIAGGAYTEFTPEQYAAWLAAYNEEYRRRMMQYCPYPPYV